MFAVKIKAVQVKELPALDDEFAKDISDFDTLDALKAAHPDVFPPEPAVEAAAPAETPAPADAPAVAPAAEAPAAEAPAAPVPAAEAPAAQ